MSYIAIGALFHFEGRQHHVMLAVQDLIQYWITQYDWRAQEAKLNSSLHHFKMPVNSVDVHFVHERSPNEHAVPLILIHGWPGSFLEFTELIPKLVNPGNYCIMFCSRSPNVLNLTEIAMHCFLNAFIGRY